MVQAATALCHRFYCPDKALQYSAFQLTVNLQEHLFIDLQAKHRMNSRFKQEYYMTATWLEVFLQTGPTKSRVSFHKKIQWRKNKTG